MRAAQSCPGDWRPRSPVRPCVLLSSSRSSRPTAPSILMCREASRVKWQELEVRVRWTRIQCYPLHQLWKTRAPHLTCLNLSFLDCKMGILTEAQTTYFLLQGLQLSNQKTTSICSEFLLPFKVMIVRIFPTLNILSYC